VAYWQTVWLVIRRVGRLGDYVRGPVSLPDALKFRWLVLAHAAVGLLVSFAALLGAKRYIHIDNEMLLTVGSATVASALLAMLAQMAVPGWVLRRRDWSLEQQSRLVALSYYTCAPLALWPLAAVPILVACALFHRMFWVSILRLTVGGFQNLLWLWWLVLVTVAARSVARRSAVGGVMTAVLTPLLWIVVGAAVALLLPGLAMLFMLWGSLGP